MKKHTSSLINAANRDTTPPHSVTTNAVTINTTIISEFTLFYAYAFVAFVALCVLSVALPVHADKAFAFSLHPQAKVFEQSTYSETQYIVALDKYRKVDNRWVPRKWQRQAGRLLRYTLEMPRDYVEPDVLSYYDGQLPDNAELLFGCDGRACGESNNWANDHFGIKQLYGIDTSQRYRTYRMPVVMEENVTEKQPLDYLYVTAYVVRRGNRRLYVQLDILYPR
ncbi:DUF4892 domain-containing protein [Eionea flava]